MSEITEVVTLTGHVEDRVWHLSWSHDGCYLASCGEDKVLRIWGNLVNPTEGNWNDNPENIGCLVSLEEAQTRTLRSCEWSPDSSLIACASFDGSVVVWEAQSKDGKVWEQIASLEGHESEVKSCHWSCDGNILATSGRDKKIWIWEKLDGGEFECISMLEGHSQDVKFVKFHHKFPVLFSSSYDDTIKVWKEDGDDWYCAATLSGGHSSTIWGLSISYNSPVIVSCSADNSVVIWGNNNADFNGTWRILSRLNDLQKFSIYSIDWSHDNGKILTGAGDNSIALLSWDTSSGREVATLLEEQRISHAHGNDINCVRWNPHSKYQNFIASAADDGCVKIWKYIF